MRPLFGAPPLDIVSYGSRTAGVDWLWASWVAFSQVVFCVLLPIELAEALFADWREEPWLGPIGMIGSVLATMAGVTMLGGNLAPHRLHGSASPDTLGVTSAVAAAFVLTALATRRRPASNAPAMSVSDATVVATLSLTLAGGWFLFLVSPPSLGIFPGTGMFVVSAAILAMSWSLLLGRKGLSTRWRLSDRAAAALGAAGPVIWAGYRALAAGDAVDRSGHFAGCAFIAAVTSAPMLREHRRRRSRRASSVHRVLVVGAGVAGPVCALLLKRAGYDVELFEGRAAPQGDEGGGLTIAPNGMSILAKLGLDEAARAAGAVTHSMSFSDERGTRVASIFLGSPAGFPVTLARASLQELLLEAVRSAEIPLHYEQRLRSVEPAEEGVVALFEHGRRVSADMIVGADGIHSAVRCSVVDPLRYGPRCTGLTNVGRFTASASELDRRDELRLFFGERAFFATAPLSAVRGGRTLWWTSVAVAEGGGDRSPREEGAESLRDLVLERYAPLGVGRRAPCADGGPARSRAVHRSGDPRSVRRTMTGGLSARGMADLAAI